MKRKVRIAVTGIAAVRNREVIVILKVMVSCFEFRRFVIGADKIEMIIKYSQTQLKVEPASQVSCLVEWNSVHADRI